MAVRLSLRFWSAALLLLVALPAYGEKGSPPPEKATNIIVYGNDPCPQSSSDEIVVCARKPEEERYRIPKDLRDKEQDALSRPWPDRAQGLEEAARYALPGYCSPVGPSSQSGCFEEMIRRWQVERRLMKSEENIAR